MNKGSPYLSMNSVSAFRVTLWYLSDLLRVNTIAVTGHWYWSWIHHKGG